MITATINVDDPRLYEVVQQEAFKTERTGFTVAQENNQVVFKIEAKDATAFRAAFNSITQMLTVYENMKGLGK